MNKKSEDVILMKLKTAQCLPVFSSVRHWMDVISQVSELFFYSVCGHSCIVYSEFLPVEIAYRHPTFPEAHWQSNSYCAHTQWENSAYLLCGSKSVR